MPGRHVISGLVLIGVAGVAAAQLEDLTAAVRPLLESSLREQAGIGFERFSCVAELPLVPDERFTCTAVDEDGDLLRYTLAIDDDGIATVVRASQPAASLPAELRAAISAPCLRFLESFDGRSWDALLAELHPSLQSELDEERVRERLQAVRAVLGEMQPVDSRWYTATPSGRHQLEYPLRSEVDGAVARFEIETDNDGRWRVISFLVTGEAGTEASAALVAAQGRRLLGGILGSPVTAIHAAFRELSLPGDLVEGTAVLADGREVPIAIQQTGHLDDFDASDYFFSQLDAEMIVAAGLEKRFDDVTDVACDAPVVPDGDEIRCVYSRAAGPPAEVVLSRRGAQHRLRGTGESRH